MKNLVPGAIFKDIPILTSEDVPECPKCGKQETVVMQMPTGASVAMCMACSVTWPTPKIIKLEDPDEGTD